jgi:hypothetical protein
MNPVEVSSLSDVSIQDRTVLYLSECPIETTRIDGAMILTIIEFLVRGSTRIMGDKVEILMESKWLDLTDKKVLNIVYESLVYILRARYDLLTDYYKGLKREHPHICFRSGRNPEEY